MLVYKHLFEKSSEILDLDENILCRFVFIRNGTGQTQAPSRQAMTSIWVSFTKIDKWPTFSAVIVNNSEWEILYLQCRVQCTKHLASYCTSTGPVSPSSWNIWYLVAYCRTTVFPVSSPAVVSKTQRWKKLFSPCYKTSLICHICHAVSKL